VGPKEISRRSVDAEFIARNRFLEKRKCGGLKNDTIPSQFLVVKTSLKGFTGKGYVSFSFSIYCDISGNSLKDSP